MKAVIKPRINVEKHTVLGEAVPLSTPFVVMIDPSSLCNSRCRFCPSGNPELVKGTGRFQGFLDMPLYRKVIDGLAEFDEPVRVVRLFKDGEPLLHPEFADMVRYAKDCGHVERVDTTTNGFLLSPGLNRKLIAAGLDQINISVPGMSSAAIRDNVRVALDFERYVENIRDLCENRGSCEIYVKAINELLSEDDRKRFYDVFGVMASRVFLEHIYPNWPRFEFEGLDVSCTKGFFGQEVVDRRVCPFIFYIMVVNADGTCNLCVDDWQHTMIYADLSKDTPRSAWNNRTITAHRMAHLRGQREASATCAACEAVHYAPVDNLDPYAERIEQRMWQMTECISGEGV